MDNFYVILFIVFIYGLVVSFLFITTDKMLKQKIKKISELTLCNKQLKAQLSCCIKKSPALAEDDCAFKFIHTEKPEKSVSCDYIQEVEQKYSIKFPEILHVYYREHNGAEMEETPFVVHGIDFCVQFIIPLKYGTVTFEKLSDLYINDEDFPKGFIPLAEDTDGDDYYWDSNNGRVYYLSMGNVDNPIPIASSVEEFFELLNACYKNI